MKAAVTAPALVPHEEVEMLTEGARRKRLLEGRQDTDLVEHADDAPAGENEGRPFALGGRHSALRVCDHGSSPSVTTERWPGCR
jgi:hypothetical protein